MPNASVLRSGIRRWGECAEFVELARRMSVPAEVAIREFMDLGTRPRTADHAPAPDRAQVAELVTISS